MPTEYLPATCSYCGEIRWCEKRANGNLQCRACKVERFFDRVLYPPLGYSLLDWQRKILRDLYGTVEPDLGQRRYRKAYISVAKQNGKSFLFGGLPIYHLLMETELQPEAYGIASARDQASIVFNAAKMLVDVNPDLKKRLKVLESTKRILRRDGNGIYAVLSADGDVQDGKRPSLLMFDELHRFTRKKSGTVRTVLMKGMKSRIRAVEGREYGEPLMLQATTSGSEHESPIWFSEYEYAQHVLDGSIQDPRYYAVIYQADPKRIEAEPDYWKSREARVAANPSHEDRGGFLTDRSIEEEMLEAVSRPEQYGDYVRLDLNVPVDVTSSPAIDMTVWCQGGAGVDLRTWPEYDVDLLISKWGLMGRQCVIGVDLAWTTDLTAMSCVFPPEQADEPWKTLLFYWIPEGRIPFIEQRTRVPISDWVRRKFMTAVPGVEMDASVLEERIKWAGRVFDVREMTFDKWGGMRALAQKLIAEEGMLCIDIRQGYASISAPTKEFLGHYMANRLAHGNNPIFNWNASCLALASDGADNVKPDKPARDTASKRIDGISATITAFARAPLLQETTIRYTGLRSVAS